MTNETEICRLCGQEVPKEGISLDKAVTKLLGWNKLAQVGASARLTDFGAVETIAASVQGGERHFGGDIQAQIVILVDGVLWRKLGTTDSYGETTWDGALVRVVPRTQNIRSWERL